MSSRMFSVSGLATWRPVPDCTLLPSSAILNVDMYIIAGPLSGHDEKVSLLRIKSCLLPVQVMPSIGCVDGGGRHARALTFVVMTV